MDQRAEILRAAEIFREQGSRELAPQELIERLTAELSCTFEHARDLIFGAVDLGLLRLTPGYALTSAESSGSDRRKNL